MHWHMYRLPHLAAWQLLGVARCTSTTSIKGNGELGKSPTGLGRHRDLAQEKDGCGASESLVPLLLKPWQEPYRAWTTTHTSRKEKGGCFTM